MIRYTFREFSELPKMSFSLRIFSDPIRIAGFLVIVFFSSVGESKADSAIDVTFLYSTSTKNYLGGSDGLKAYRALLVATANKSFRESGIPLTVRARGLKRVGQGSNGTTLKVINRMRKRESGFRKIDSWQRKYRNDLFCMLIRFDPFAGGRANLPIDPLSKRYLDYNSESRCFSSISVSNSNALTFAHEIGHNLGCFHAHKDTKGDSRKDARQLGTPKYAFGHRFLVPSPPPGPGEEPVLPTLYGTVMSYRGMESGVFSSPELLFGGVPTGVANRSDNARVIRKSRKLVARYSQRNRRLP